MNSMNLPTLRIAQPPTWPSSAFETCSWGLSRGRHSSAFFTFIKKTLLCLARCQLVLKSTAPALSTIRSVLALEPTNVQAQISTKEEEMGATGHWRWYPRRLADLEGRIGVSSNQRKLGWPVSSIFSYLSQWHTSTEVCNSPDDLSLRGLVLFLCGRLRQAPATCDKICITFRSWTRTSSTVSQTRERQGNCQLKEGGTFYLMTSKIKKTDRFLRGLEKLRKKERVTVNGSVRRCFWIVQLRCWRVVSLPDASTYFHLRNSCFLLPIIVWIPADVSTNLSSSRKIWYRHCRFQICHSTCQSGRYSAKNVIRAIQNEIVERIGRKVILIMSLFDQMLFYRVVVEINLN